jgi:hypothetical protein
VSLLMGTFWTSRAHLHERDARRLGRPVPAQQRSDPGWVISMSIAIIDTFRRAMGISSHLHLFDRAAGGGRVRTVKPGDAGW